MKNVIAVLCLSIAVSVLAAGVMNVRDYGAKGDGNTFDTAAIQKALDACAAAGGTVEFPAGIYLSQPLTLRSKTTVQLDPGAILQAGTNQSDFMKEPGDWLKAKSSGDFIPFIGGKGLAGLTITGGGTIDGGGAAWWGEAEKARQRKPGYTLPRPNLIALDHCRDVRVENVTLQNSPKFHLVPADCDDVVISNVTILAPEHAANTDAIDPSGRHILITHCKLDVGDDNVAIKAGGKNGIRDFQSEDIRVTDCTFLHGHGMSIGSETSGGIRDVTVTRCTFSGTENGLRIKSDVRRGGTVENILYEDITMTNVNPAITLTCVYQGTSAGDAKAPAHGPIGSKLPMFRDIGISNLTATCPKSAGIILGLPDCCISNVTLQNVHIAAAKSFELHNVRGVRFVSSSITVKQGPPVTAENAETEGMPTEK
jgi:polygalacturonase